MAYTKTTWSSGDTITAAKLNNIETGVGNALLASDVNSTVVPSDIGAEPALPATGGITTNFLRSDKTWAPVSSGLVVPNVQSSSYTTVLSDAGKVIEFTGSSTSYFVLPSNASVAYPIGTVIEIFQLGTGTVNVGSSAGSIRSRGNVYNLAGQYASAAVRLRATDEWVLTGDIVA